MSLAKVTIIGNLGRDPETRYTPSGTMNVSFSMAASRRFRDSSGQDQERTTWFRVTAWGRLAETIDGLSQRGIVGKGRQVYVEGRIEQSEWTGNDGEKRTSLEVNASEFQLLGNRADSQGGGEGDSGSYAGGNSGGGNYGNSGNSGGAEGGGGNSNRRQNFNDSPASDMDDIPF